MCVYYLGVRSISTGLNCFAVQQQTDSAFLCGVFVISKTKRFHMSDEMNKQLAFHLQLFRSSEYLLKLF